MKQVQTWQEAVFCSLPGEQIFWKTSPGAMSPENTDYFILGEEEVPEDGWQKVPDEEICWARSSQKIFSWGWTVGKQNPVARNCSRRDLHVPHNYLLRAWTSPGNADYAVCNGNQPGARIEKSGRGLIVIVPGR